MRMPIRRALMVAVAGLGMTVTGAGAAHAVAGVPSVGSDKIKLAGPATPTPVPGTYSFATTTCALRSDLETTSFACQGSGQISINAMGGTGFANVASADGAINWKFKLTPSGSTSFKLTGAGTEQDNPENGVVPPPYPARMRGTLQLVMLPTGGLGVVASVAVTEAVGAP